MNSFYSLLKNRRSTRKFAQDLLTPDEIDTLKKAVLMSPSGKSLNEWEFIFIDNKSTLAKLAESKEHGSELISGAPFAVAVIVDKGKSDVWIEDASVAAIILQLQAEDLDLGSCWVQIRQRKTKQGELSEDYVRNLLSIPEHYAVECIIAIGRKEQQRKPYDDKKLPFEKVHYNTF
jgi:nitroreductase